MTEAGRKLVIVPAFNEGAAIGSTVGTLTALPQVDVLIVNDGSTDDTAAKAAQLSRDNPRVFYVSLPLNSGIGAAVQTGFIFAARNGYEYAAQFDGDGQHDSQSLQDLFTFAETNDVDLCIGSRFLNLNAENFRSTPTRRIGIAFFARLISFLSGVRVTDPTSGMRVCSARVITRFACDYPDDYPEPESLFWCARHGLKVAERPATMHPRVTGVSSIRYLQSGYYMIKVTAAILLDRLRSKEVRK